MQNEVHDNKQHPEQQAQYLLDQLHKLYLNYLEKNQQYVQSNKSFSKVLGKLFTGSDPLAADSMHEEFLSATSQLIKELEEPLKLLQQDSPGLSCNFAKQAVNQMMVPKSAKERAKSTAEWFLTIAEYQCAPILPYLSLEAMEEFRHTMFPIPRRMMFPKEKEFFDLFVKVLESKRKQG